ncbi:MAG: amidohydrolase family protein, partial [Candidatus Binataceae bacterium]
MSLAGFRIIDADGHVTEPASLYTTHIDPKFRAAADAMLTRTGVGNLGIVPAIYPKWRSAERPLGERDEVPGLGKFPSGKNHPLASPTGGLDPNERIADMDKEGIDVAVCFATVATSVCGVADPAMEAALARAYNCWIGEYCSAAPARIKAVGIVPQRTMETCVAEVEYLSREPWAVGIMTFGN